MYVCISLSLSIYIYIYVYVYIYIYRYMYIHALSPWPWCPRPRSSRRGRTASPGRRCPRRMNKTIIMCKESLLLSQLVLMLSISCCC